MGLKLKYLEIKLNVVNFSRTEVVVTLRNSLDYTLQTFFFALHNFGPSWRFIAVQSNELKYVAKHPLSNEKEFLIHVMQRSAKDILKNIDLNTDGLQNTLWSNGILLLFFRDVQVSSGHLRY